MIFIIILLTIISLEMLLLIGVLNSFKNTNILLDYEGFKYLTDKAIQKIVQKMFDLKCVVKDENGKEYQFLMIEKEKD